MADILKVTSPVIGKNIVQQNKNVTDPSIPFDLQEISHIARNPNSSALLSQHNIFQRDAGAATLMNLLKDPDVTVNYLKNITMLEEIISLLPVNNNTVTEEIQQLFQALLIHPDSIVDEMMRQEYSSTLFKGPLFDFLRSLVKENPELRTETAELLKAINSILSRKDAEDSAANGFSFLAEQLSASKNLAPRLRELAAGFRQDDGTLFQELKLQAQALLKEMEGSILYTPQAARVVPNIIYNLSRYRENEAFLQEALFGLLVRMNSREAKDQLRMLVKEYIEQFPKADNSRTRSHVVDTLAEIIAKQDKESGMQSLIGDRIEKILTSLLSSPCNYTPLLHFVIPVDFQGMKAFSELWIDPDDREASAKDGGDGSHIHILITFDIEGIGQLEAEFMVSGKTINFLLLCPKGYVKLFSGLLPEFKKIAEQKGYQMSDAKVEKLEHIRSLMDVFKTLPYRRTGVDVKI